MCGIAGLFVARPPGGTSVAELAERMTVPIRHRGPDDAGVWASEEHGVALGFRRLSIIDLSALGHQPMQSRSGRFTIIFNGEVFNHHEIRRELLARGASFRGHSDTEVMLASFEAWGVTEATKRFVGMFGFAVWDVETRSLSLVRDRLGIKPMYVYARDGIVAFGSELKALRALPGFDAELNQDAVTSYLRYLYIPAPLSVYRHVQKLLPGHILTIRNPSERLPESQAYWSVADVAASRLEAREATAPPEIAGEFRRRLAEAVALRMEADVPLGALLSGGIDSSTVVALMQAASTQRVKTFTIGFESSDHDESGYARAIAKHLGTDHTELRVTGAEALNVVPLLPDMFDEPLADPSQIPTYLVSRLARQHVTVALTGDGGDELMGGYNRYLVGESLIEKSERLPRGLRQTIAAGIGLVPSAVWDTAAEGAAALPGGDRLRLLGGKMSKAARLLAQDSAHHQYRSLLSAWDSPTDFLPGSTDPVTRGEDYFNAAGSWPLLDRMLLWDQTQYLPDDLLAKVDRASMAVSLEARVPLLDHRLVEWTWSLPRSTKLRDGRGKWLLREVLYGLVPREMVDREKVGFTVPIDEWLRGPLREWAGDLLNGQSLQSDGLLDAGAVTGAWDSFQKGNRSSANGIWALAMLVAWRRRWC